MPPKPSLPGNPMGGPPGPGASPMTTPGGGPGAEAATDAKVAKVMETLYAALQAYPLGSKKQQAVLNAVRALTANFAKQADAGQVPPAITQMALNPRPANAAPMPPMAPPGGPPGAAPGGAPGAPPEPPMM